MITWIVSLYVGGMLLLLSELVMPGLVCGILGTAMVAGSMWLSAQTYPEFAWTLVLAELFVGVVLFMAGVWMLPKIAAQLGFSHTTTMDAAAGYVNVAEKPELVGVVGRAEGMLRPSGIVLFGEERMDVVTTGEFIEAGAAVRVIAVEGNRVVVERA